MATQSIASFKWTGASGQQIGFADQNPYNKYGPSFTADEVHQQNYDPNTPNTYAIPGEIGEVPIAVQDDYYLEYDGSNGWVLDNLYYPWHEDDAGTTGHHMPMGAAQGRNIDPAHSMDVYQLQMPGNHGINFYGKSTDSAEAYQWSSSSAQPKTRRTSPLDARFDTSNWPEPFDSYTVAPQRPVILPTERIPMNRMSEDDRPTYRQLAVPAQNIRPSGSVFNPMYESNPALHNVKPLPAVSRIPVPPWSQDEIASASDQVYPEDVDVFYGMSLQ